MTATDYLKAAKALSKAEDALNAALDRLDAAREGGNPDDVTRTRLAAVEADKAASAAWDNAETARRAFWRQRHEAQEARIVAECLPLLVQLAAYQRFAGLPATPPEHFLRPHLIAPQAYAEPEGDVRIEPLPAPGLDRADDELFGRWSPPQTQRVTRKT